MSRTTLSFETPIGTLRIEREAHSLGIEDIEAWKRQPASYSINGSPITAEQYATTMRSWAKSEGL